MNTEENIIKKLKYIGLDLNNIPNEIMEFNKLDFRPKNSEEIKYYKVYKYINVNDIKETTPYNTLDAVKNNRIYTNLMIMIHHGFADGNHIGIFLNKLNVSSQTQTSHESFDFLLIF